MPILQLISILNSNLKMIYFLVKTQNNLSDPENLDSQWTINLNGKSYVSILHEYIQRVLKTQPSYEFKELG